MWLYIQSNSAQASACSEKACAPHSSYSASGTALSLTWSGKPLQPRSLSALWKREPLIRRLSGLICSPSTAQLGADAWISSLRASRARTSASPAGVLALMASARACSSTSSTSPTIAVREGSFWRTSAPSLLPPPPLWTKPKALLKNAPPPASWESWPTAGGTRSGSIFPRPTWAPATGARDGSALLGGTWSTLDTGHERINQSASAGAAERPAIALKAQQWPTPRATDGTKGGPNQAGSKGDLMLPSAAAQWPTPASRDYRTPNSQESQESQESRKHTGGEQLPNFVEHHFLPQALLTPDGQTSCKPPHGSPRRLNPAFAAWLMGWPWWWTNPALTSCAKSAMASYRCRLQWHLLSLCGGQRGDA